MCMRGKTGVVDVGGGYRGDYAAGVLEYCLDHGVAFDLGIGVSARQRQRGVVCRGAEPA